jgi:predicted transcriptional regulator
MQYKRRLDEILENVSSGIFTLEDAKDFIEIGDKFAFNEDYERIWEAYRWKILIPVLAGKEEIVILGLLNEKSEPYNSKQLKQEVQRICLVNPILYRIAIESLVEDGFIIHHKSLLRDRYEITEKGKVAALLTNKLYQEITKNTGVKSL